MMFATEISTLAAMRRSLAALALSLSACVQSEVEICSNGIVCPAGNTCEAGKCVDPVQREACNGLAEMDPCAVRGLPGMCHTGLCEPTFCGDGIRTATEDCDGDDLGGETCTSLHFWLGEQ